MALILTRKAGERLHIGSDITITVMEVEGGKVRLSIECPRDVPIFRQEVMERGSEGNEPDRAA